MEILIDNRKFCLNNLRSMYVQMCCVNEQLKVIIKFPCCANENAFIGMRKRNKLYMTILGASMTALSLYFSVQINEIDCTINMYLVLRILELSE